MANGAAPEKPKELKQVPNPATMNTADLLQVAAKEVELQRQVCVGLMCSLARCS